VITLEIAVDEGRLFYGIVLARETHAPIVGAKVLVMRTNGRPFPRDEGGGFESDVVKQMASDVEGRFTWQAPSWQGQHLRIDASGYGPVIVRPGAKHSSKDGEQVIVLDRSATLEGSVVDASGAPMPGVRVVLVADGNDLDRTDVLIPAETSPLSMIRWSATTSADGRCRLVDIAPNVELRVVLEKNDHVLRIGEPTMQLEPGSTAHREWKIGAGCTLRGALFDESKAPVPSHIVWLIRAHDDNARYLTRGDEFELEARTSTDDQGRFSFDDVPAARWLVGPAPAPTNARAPEASALAPFAQLVEVPVGAHRLDIAVRSQRGLFIRGRVVDSAGSPLRGAYVGSVASVPMVTNDEGAFAVGPLIPGAISLRAGMPGTNASSSSVTANAGDSNVVLTVFRPSIVTGRVIDPLTDKPCAAELTFSLRPATESHAQAAIKKIVGSFDLDLEPGVQDFVARSDDGRIAVLRAVVVGSEARVGGLELSLERGARVRVRYDGPAPQSWFAIFSAHAFMCGDGLTNGQERTVTVPSGRLVITFGHGTADASQRREIDVSVGEEALVTFVETK
jgi:protocatechuate 3,4-dioxygenase beta subunit